MATKSLKSFVCFTVLLLESASVQQAGGANWKLSWADEFEGPRGATPDHCNWNFEIGDMHAGWGNNELQYYTSERDNSALDGSGNLVISALKIPGENLNRDCYYGKCLYTSARLFTQTTFEQQYGKFEARIKLPQGMGLWPAFWMLGNNADEVGWPKCGLITIVDQRGSRPSTVAGTIHGPDYSGAQGLSAEYVLKNGQKFSDDFHVFAVEWTDRAISWSVDGQEYHRQTKDVGPLAGKQWVFDHPFYLVLNLAVGGTHDGNPDDRTVFPAHLVIDYVRAYQ